MDRFDERMGVLPDRKATGRARRLVAAAISSAAITQLSYLRLAITTSAPAAANPSATARPMPRLPPVITATFPVRSNSSAGVSIPPWWHCTAQAPTADLLTQRLQVHEKTAWMLRSLLA